MNALKNNNCVQSYLENPEASNKQKIFNAFELMISAMHKFTQIRIINEDDDSISIVRDENLQDKSKRYYTQKSKVLKDGEFYISNFDLNIEHGEVTTPYEPTIHFF